MNDCLEQAWYSLTLQHPQIEEYAYLIFEQQGSELQVVGVQILDNCQATAFIRCSQQQLQLLPSALAAYEICVLEIRKLAPSELAPHPAEVYEALQIGTLRIVPVRELPPQKAALAPADCSEIVIVPGTGFGTGHHATTRLVIEMLQSPEFLAATPSRGLDLGCGSAILALAAAAIHACPIDAVDNDPLALENAQLNLQGNPSLASHIRIHLRDAWQPQQYQLILANLYSSLLHDSAELLTRIACSGALLAISGFTLAEQESLHLRFKALGWEKVKASCAGDWCAAGFRLLWEDRK